jgi:hypothetical protein
MAAISDRSWSDPLITDIFRLDYCFIFMGLASLIDILDQ